MVVRSIIFMTHRRPYNIFFLLSLWKDHLAYCIQCLLFQLQPIPEICLGNWLNRVDKKDNARIHIGVSALCQSIQTCPNNVVNLPTAISLIEQRPWLFPLSKKDIFIINLYLFKQYFGHDALAAACWLLIEQIKICAKKN